MRGHLILIDEEDYAYPLSDTQLANKLAAQGTPIAHRTVSKWRERVTTLRVSAPQSRSRYFCELPRFV